MTPAYYAFAAFATAVFMAALFVFDIQGWRDVKVTARRAANRSGLTCGLRGWHDTARTAHDGFRCLLCRKACSDYEDAGFADGAYVSSTRRVFERQTSSVTRTSAFAPTRRGW